MKNQTKQIYKTAFYLIITLLIFHFTSCNKEEYNTSDATITWTGAYEIDGCGFFITIGNHKYKPENESLIDDEYKTIIQSVVIEYEITNKQIESNCGDLTEPTITDGLRIISIKKK